MREGADRRNPGQPSLSFFMEGDIAAARRNRDRRKNAQLRKRLMGTGDPVVEAKIQEQIAQDNYQRDWSVPPRGSKIPLQKVLKEGAWKGERCFLIGGGPSLKDFDFNRLKNQGRIIAINKAFLFAPFADLMFSMDYRFYKWVHFGINIVNQDDPEFAELVKSWKKRYQEFAGLKVWMDLKNKVMDDIYYVRAKRGQGMSKSIKTGLFGGNNSGFAALQLAILLEADPIYLLGFDMKHAGGKTHFHGGYPIRQRAVTVKLFIEKFAEVAERQKARARIYNLNPDSELRCFEFGDLDRVLKGGLR